MTILLTLAGFALLLLGGEVVVRGAIRLAPRLGVSPLMIGIVIVGFGDCDSRARGQRRCGSVRVARPRGGQRDWQQHRNAMMILGFAAVICPVVVDRTAIRHDTLVLIGATLAFSGIGFFAGQVAWWHGASMVAVLVAYVVWRVRRDAGVAPPRASSAPEAQSLADAPPAHLSFVLLAAGLAAVLVGAECLVHGAVRLAADLGVGEEVIGLTLIAVGTSLPEMATSLAAALRARTELCLGNVIGSNLFNILGIAGVTALFAPLPFAGRIVDFDLWFLLGTTAFMALVMMASRRIGRLSGVVLSAIYGGYIAAHFAVAA